MSTSMELEKVHKKNEADEIIPPTIHTGRQPNLFVSALAMGPDKEDE